MTAAHTPTTSAPPPSTRDAARRPPLLAFIRKWASQFGIRVGFLMLWLAFGMLAPDTFGSDLIYKSFGQTIP